uniref:Uncharacterized protein n=1 Tax=Lutzomyia longipalpis TaxID=7200 RepID=A0A1B0CNI5_LUTLO
MAFNESSPTFRRATVGYHEQHCIADDIFNSGGICIDMVGTNSCEMATNERNCSALSWPETGCNENEL